jgi:hypothetical protein
MRPVRWNKYMKNGLFMGAEEVEVAHRKVLSIISSTLPDKLAENRDFEDELEVWLAALLAAHPRWTRQGRWFDGLLNDYCEVDESCVRVSGRVFDIYAQRPEVTFAATVSLDGRDFQFEVSAPEVSPSLHIRRAPPRYAFPVHRWGRTQEHESISAVRVDEATGGFLFITQERDGTFDIFLENESDVVEALSGMSIVWDPAALELY